MKNKIEKVHCEGCDKFLPFKKIYSLTWRYNDKERTYVGSKVKIIHTGRKFLCKKCLEDKIK